MKFIVNTITGWEEPPRARHQLTHALVKAGHEVVFVAKNKVGRPFIQFSNETKNIVLVTPYIPIDYRFRYRLPVINELYQNWLFSWLKKHYPDYIVINFDFTAYRLNSFFNKVIYYCNDEYIGNSKYPNFFINKYHQFCEKALTEKSKFGIGTAKSIVDKLKQFNSNIFNIPLGAPSLDFTGGGNFNKKINRQSLPLNIGLVGFITTRNISVYLVNKILDEGFKLTIVGPVEDEFLKQIPDQAFLELKGSLIGEKLFEVIADFDIAIAPYDLKKANAGTTPNKIWQYLVMGKPVIVSNLPNIHSMNIPDKLIYIATDDNDFIPLIKQAHYENTLELIDSRIKFAKENSWDERAKEFISLVRIYFQTNENSDSTMN